MRLGELVRAGLSRVDTVAVKRTAINPILWLVGLISPLSLILTAVVGDETSRLILFCFAGVPILSALAVYLIFMFRDPDRLQSEEYRIRQQEMRLRYRKGRKPVVVDATNEVGRLDHDRGVNHEN